MLARVGWVLRSHATQGEIGVLPATALSEASWVTTHASMHEPGGRDALTNLSASILTSGTLPDARLSSNVALENTANVFTENQKISRDTPRLQFIETDQPADQRHFEIAVGGQEFYFQALNDAETLASGAMRFSRSGSLTVTQDLYEKNRSTAMGHWQAVPFNAANFIGQSPMTWTVAAGNVVVNRYMLVGKTLHWNLMIQASALGGTATHLLYAYLPVGSCASAGTGLYQLRNAGTWKAGGINWVASGVTISIHLIEWTNFPIPDADCHVYLNVCLELA